MSEDARKVFWSADLGGGNDIEVDLEAGEDLVIIAGAGIKAADVWMKDNALRLRVSIKRTEPNVLEIKVDRGPQNEKWWPPEGSPSLKIITQQLGVAEATASVGTGTEFQEVYLGRIDI